MRNKALRKQLQSSNQECQLHTLSSLVNIESLYLMSFLLTDLLLNQVASPVVAVLLLVLKTADTDLHRELCKLIIKSCKLQAKQLNERWVELSSGITHYVIPCLPFHSDFTYESKTFSMTTSFAFS